jgi:hypothetical protein
MDLGFLGSASGTLTKADVGLGNVDNTSDVNKPVSTATQTALNLKLNAADYNDRFKGVYATLGALQAAHATGASGDYAQVDPGAGTNLQTYSWDVQNGWVLSSTDGTGAQNTDQLTEGATNLYFTTLRAQTAAPAETATTIGAIVTGVSEKTTPVDADTFTLYDSVASALKKVSGTNLKAYLKTYFDTLYPGTSGFTMAGILDMAGNIFKNAKIGRFSELPGSASISSGVLTLDFTNGNFFAVTLTENVTSVSLTNLPVTTGYTFMAIEFTQDGIGGKTVTGWPAGTKWPNGNVPTITNLAGAVDVVSGYINSAGTVLRLSVGMQHSS